MVSVTSVTPCLRSLCALARKSRTPNPESRADPRPLRNCNLLSPCSEVPPSALIGTHETVGACRISESLICGARPPAQAHPVDLSGVSRHLRALERGLLSRAAGSDPPLADRGHPSCMPEEGAKTEITHPTIRGHRPALESPGIFDGRDHGCGCAVDHGGRSCSAGPPEHDFQLSSQWRRARDCQSPGCRQNAGGGQFYLVAPV